MSETKEAGPDDDAEIARILAMSEEELRADLIADGRDPDQVVDSMRREVSAMIELVQERDRLRGEVEQHKSDAQGWHADYRQARREKNEVAAQNARLREAVKRSHQATGSLEQWLAEKDPDLVLPLALGLMLIDSRQKREAALSQDPPHAEG